MSLSIAYNYTLNEQDVKIMLASELIKSLPIDIIESLFTFEIKDKDDKHIDITCEMSDYFK